MISLTFFNSLLKIRVTQIIYFKSLKEWQHPLSTPNNILCLLYSKTWNSYGRYINLRYPSVLEVRAREIVRIEGLKNMKTLKNHLMSYGNGLLLQGSAWIEV
jgi:hypothetical protein